MTSLRFSGAIRTYIFLIFDTGISYTDVCLDIPMLVQDPLVSVRDPCSIEGSLIAMVFQTFPESERQIDACRLINPSVCMYTDNVSVEPVAKPKTLFRLKCKHFKHFVIVAFPGIVVGIQI